MRAAPRAGSRAMERISRIMSALKLIVFHAIDDRPRRYQGTSLTTIGLISDDNDVVGRGSCKTPTGTWRDCPCSRHTVMSTVKLKRHGGKRFDGRHLDASHLLDRDPFCLNTAKIAGAHISRVDEKLDAGGMAAYVEN